MAQIKLYEMWKATHVNNYPTKFTKHMPLANSVQTRACTNEKLIEQGFKPLSKKSFKNDAARLWNITPIEITSCEIPVKLKELIKLHAKLFPI